MPKLPKFTLPRRTKKLRATATAARRAPATDSYYDEEPRTNLSTAFIVVLVLHVVAVGGIYAFNSIHAARQSREQKSVLNKSTPAAPKPAPEPPKAATQSAAATAPVSKANVYHVQPGDTLTRIAAMHSTTVAELEALNDIKNANGLRAGQVLTIPPAKSASKPVAPAAVIPPGKSAFLAKVESTPAPAATPKPGTSPSASGRTYVVAKGDTPTSIAKKFGTTASELLKLNKVDDPKKVQIGQTLKVPAKKEGTR
jgi:peptidoglycan endopeptidase LytE